MVLNWFLHSIYWTDQIKSSTAVAARSSRGGSAATLGLVMLGFTCVYREGFEVVLFLQSLSSRPAPPPWCRALRSGPAATAVVGVLTFVLQRRLPYRRMLVVTGVMIGFVLVVMIGGTASTFQDLGWLPGTLGVALPDWMARWFEVFPTVETIAAQVLAAVLVAGLLLPRRAPEGAQAGQARPAVPAVRAEAAPEPGYAG